MQNQGNSRVGACNPGLLTMAAKSTSSKNPIAEGEVYLQMKAMSWSHACLSSSRDGVPGPIVTVTQLPMAAGTAVVRRPVLHFICNGEALKPYNTRYSRGTCKTPAHCTTCPPPPSAHHHSSRSCNLGSQMLGKSPPSW